MRVSQLTQATRSSGISQEFIKNLVWLFIETMAAMQWPSHLWELRATPGVTASPITGGIDMTLRLCMYQPGEGHSVPLHVTFGSSGDMTITWPVDPKLQTDVSAKDGAQYGQKAIDDLSYAIREAFAATAVG
ncbi:hypothetical protein [Polyangium fumosum]|uniref:Uncharacterized protein n=1 Tax=Polyangium fumosum TaxID=889272 RepID=A0A4U1I7F5_9BACT|nr:hypothetical protein [Polyangium fumosum]TKC89175.1 hypothetical protein E8A74_51345 [Polyangium fumosum]